MNLILNDDARGNPSGLWAIFFFSSRLLVTLIAAILTGKMAWKTSIDLWRFPRSGTWATFPLQSCLWWSFGPWTCTRKLFGLTRTWFARPWTRVVRGTWHGAPYWRKPSYILINCCSHETVLKLGTHDDTINNSDQYFTAMKHVCFQSEIFAKRNPVTLSLSDE